MTTTVNFKKAGKPVSKSFRSYDAIVRCFQTELKKLDVKEKTLDQKHPELRAMLEEEKKECERIVSFYKHIINERKVVRNDITGEVLDIEYREMEA